MDPDENLKEQLLLTKIIFSRRIGEDLILEDMERLAELVQDLNTWIASGGFLPKAWQK